MQEGNYFLIPNVVLKATLEKLGADGFMWKGAGETAPFEKYFQSAVDRDYGTMIPVLEVEHSIGKDTGKEYKFIALTTDRLLEINKNERPVGSFEELKKFLKW
jgi:hypothetical protein